MLSMSARFLMIAFQGNRFLPQGAVMRQKDSLKVLVACFAFVLITIEAQGQSLVSAKVLSVEGHVEIRRATQPQGEMKKISFKLDDELKPGDSIQTNWGARLVLGLSDGSIAIIGEETKVEIADFNQSPRQLFKVLKGKTRIKIEKAGGKPNPYRVNTPTAVIAVRGTVFDIFVKKESTEVYLLEGEVVVANTFIQDIMVLLKAGQMTRVSRDSAPTTPKTFKLDRNNEQFAPPRRLTDEADSSTTDIFRTRTDTRPTQQRPVQPTTTRTPTTVRRP
jgi:hypothetical protein